MSAGLKIDQAAAVGCLKRWNGAGRSGPSRLGSVGSLVTWDWLARLSAPSPTFQGQEQILDWDDEARLQPVWGIIKLETGTP
jgi:hypothetical protein